MLAEEWPLIVFTLLTQFSTGIFILFGIFFFIGNNIKKSKLTPGFY